MCIAICKPEDVELPSKETLETCFRNNPDGAGFAYAKDGVVTIKKGYMNFNDFWCALSETNKEQKLKECGMLIHFRIGTGGGNIPGLTHPFPIVDDEGALRKIEYRSPYAVIHNGIITLTSSCVYKETQMSDTAIFIRDYLCKIAQNRQWFRRKCNIELIEKLIGSKMAIINAYGEIIKTSGFIEDNGIFYSNTTYKTYRASTYTSLPAKTGETKNYQRATYPTGYSKYDDDDYYYDSKAYSNYIGNKTIPLMKCAIGDMVEWDGLNDMIDCEEDRVYFIDKNGVMYQKIDDSNSSYKGGYSDYYASYEFLGIGQFMNSNGVPKSFSPTVWPEDSQFIGGMTPQQILKDYITSNDTPPFSTKDETKENVKS